MPIFLILFLFLCFFTFLSSAYTSFTKSSAPSPTRRKLLTNSLPTAVAAATTSTSAMITNPSSAQAQDYFYLWARASSTASTSSASPATQASQACRPHSRNCIRTTWIPPSSHTRSEIISDLQQILSLYPRKGQNGIDCNGYNVVQDNFSIDESARIEFYSCVDLAAISKNFGRPFVDDVWLQLVPTVPTVEGTAGTAYTAYKVEVKCKRRVGVTDYGASKKRINYLSEELRKKHWDAPVVSY